ncbi:serine/threonine protein kinase [Streptomyces sp. Go40/10]|uniref:serine/threonine-protein kinase n=1 Tax=Streptomyces sp. Go40/10 TaxID=2825844 RepID=UPI001E2F1614|nr:serine/threonine-protein kinase [Streptomyces sp. Go40/10]UFR05572.1 serine/threonine protein kinase [Streptomyces sp. Go40/10]
MSATAAPDTPPPAPGTEPVPGYRILAGLARTGWLDVYDAWSEERDCRCVLKTVRPDRRGDRRLGERLLREGRWLLGFTHPHLVRAYDVFDAPEPVVVLEALTGETLSHLLHRLRRRASAADVALLGVQLCSAVHYLHGRGLLHLDLKPSNVVVDRGLAKVLDLSVARPPGPAPAGVGTCCHLSPEQARGGMLTAAADVWGIGATLYEVACGDLPFACRTTGGTAHRPYAGYPGDEPDDKSGTGDPGDRYPQLEREVPPIRSRRRLPPVLAAAVDGCLRADPPARPGLAALVAALETALPVPRRGG